MSDLADDILEGFRCEVCANIIDKTAPGYTRLCGACAHDIEEDRE